MEGAQQLSEGAVAEPRREAGSLLAHVIGRDRSFVIAHAADALNDDECEAFRSLIARRAGGEPLQYLTGQQEFYKLGFEVTPAVLIPRPETELIIETTLELLRNDLEPYLADIGTGSGCIAISILHELPAARAVATDISSAALQVTQRNAERHGVADRLEVLESDCFSALAATGSFSLIVSNPPYIDDDEMKNLQREVDYEPRAALAGGPDGLSVIRRLLLEAPPFLRPGGYFVFEIGFGQSEAVEQLIDRRIWQLLEIRTDLQKIPRTFVLRVRSS
ncbi:MAG TPA: peptide chain release factor N(5)-glutamine methyltransferase [Pyrinomonadaceae bacterium]|nr:peptide chain release factor N(5)-glutamine methyltransferase [Pyrinomonadaceae bacterium]